MCLLLCRCVCCYVGVFVCCVGVFVCCVGVFVVNVGVFVYSPPPARGPGAARF